MVVSARKESRCHRLKPDFRYGQNMGFISVGSSGFGLNEIIKASSLMRSLKLPYPTVFHFPLYIREVGRKREHAGNEFKFQAKLLWRKGVRVTSYGAKDVRSSDQRRLLYRDDI